MDDGFYDIDFGDDDDFMPDDEEAFENCGAGDEDEVANTSVRCLRAGEEYCSFFCPFHSQVFSDPDTD